MGRHHPRGAGSVFSTPADMAKYVEAICGGGANHRGRVLDEDVFAEMLRPQEVNLPEAVGTMRMGLAFLVNEMKGHRTAWHNGGWPGATSELSVAVDDGTGVLLFANAFSMLGAAPLDQLSRALLELVVSSS